jgi:hypothetical protein
LDATSSNQARPRGSRPRLRTVALVGSYVMVGFGVCWTLWQAAHPRSGTSTVHSALAAPWPPTPWKNARPDVKYVGDAACARCHEEIMATFRRHPMGRSLAPIAEGPSVGGDLPGGTITFEADHSQFSIERRNGREFHREIQRDEQGRILAQVQAEVKYALGSGSRGVSYLVEHDGRLFQSPISWYSQKHRWDLSPGYEQRNYHFFGDARSPETGERLRDFRFFAFFVDVGCGARNNPICHRRRQLALVFGGFVFVQSGGACHSISN